MHPTYNSPTPPPSAYDKAAQIEDEITELYAHVNAATYRLLVLIRELDKEEPWGAWGLNSCAHWLNWKCGVGMVAAREKVRVARALEELPQISERFRKGEVSYSKVRAMTRVATAENEDYLLETAEYGTAAHVEELVRKYRGVEREEELRRVKKQYARRELTYYHEEDGSLVIKARLRRRKGRWCCRRYRRVRTGCGEKSANRGKGRNRRAKMQPMAARGAIQLKQFPKPARGTAQPEHFIHCLRGVIQLNHGCPRSTEASDWSKSAPSSLLRRTHRALGERMRW